MVLGPIDLATKVMCPHCGVMGVFTADPESNRVRLSRKEIQHEVFEVDEVRVSVCPNHECSKLVVQRVVEVRDHQASETGVNGQETLFPQLPSPLPINPIIDIKYSSFVQEANSIRDISSRGAAPLLRHCLESILIDKGYGGGRDSLDTLIDKASKATGDKAISSDLLKHFDLLRHAGNWGAHPMGIEVGEAEVDQLFTSILIALDFFFVKPHELAEAERRVNEKLVAAGRPKMADRKQL